VNAVHVLHKNLTVPTSLSHAADEQRRPARRRRRHSVPSFVPGESACTRARTLRKDLEAEQSTAQHARYEIELMTHRSHQHIPDWARRSRDRDVVNHDDLTTNSSPKPSARRVAYVVPKRSPPPPTVLSPYGHAATRPRPRSATGDTTTCRQPNGMLPYHQLVPQTSTSTASFDSPTQTMLR
jgi:hypothetical protein